MQSGRQRASLGHGRVTPSNCPRQAGASAARQAAHHSRPLNKRSESAAHLVAAITNDIRMHRHRYSVDEMAPTAEGNKKTGRRHQSDPLRTRVSCSHLLLDFPAAV